jgi:hypothetical protein
LRTNPYVLAALCVTWLIVGALLYVPWLARLLHHARPTAGGFLLVALAIPAVLLADTVLKTWRRRARP